MKCYTDIFRGRIKIRLEIVFYLFILWWSWVGVFGYLVIYILEILGRMESMIVFQYWVGGIFSGSWKLGGLLIGKYIFLSELMYRGFEWEVLIECVCFLGSYLFISFEF